MVKAVLYVSKKTDFNHFNLSVIEPLVCRKWRAKL